MSLFDPEVFTVATPPLPDTPPEGARLFTYANVASMMGLSEQTVQAMVRKGQIPSPRYYGSTARFTHEAVQEIMQKRPQKPGSYLVAKSPRASRAKKAYRASMSNSTKSILDRIVKVRRAKTPRTKKQ